MAEMPSGTVTFLFTDIEGSTTRWEQHPTAMRDALARHDALLHEGITAHGGVVVTERGEGDSFFALFARPSDALAAACAVQQTLVAEPWAEEIAPLRVRMALHTGEAGLWEERDYRGAAVNRCARLRAVAHGGQVLLSGATYVLVRDSVPPEVGLRDLGIHRLKDLLQPEHIYQVVDPALPAVFPPLATLDQRLHHLPIQPTTLIGRECEVAEVRERLLDPQTRLLTLTGVGGTGKTRLALQVAAEVVDAFPDGVYVVNLAPISDPALVLPTIAPTLGVVEAGSQSLRETLHAFLHEKRLLLLLDNFEQVLEAAPVVSELLAACGGVCVLATSRAVLHLRGERLYPVPPLALPELTPLPPLETLIQYEAVRLFIERAREVTPAFAVTHETAPVIAEICTRLDGLPLAIELAAARVRLFTPQALLSRLSDRLGVLTSGARDLPVRQRTLRATIDWSYSLLTAEEQMLFARLSVFRGGRTLEAIEAVCNKDAAMDVLAGVESLLEQSLLGQTEAAGEPRFVMLETLHAYARERLETSGEGVALRQAHADYFLVLAEQAEPTLTGADQGVWLARLEAEHDNLRAALRWAREHVESPTLLRLASALYRFWLVRGYLTEGRAWLEEGLGLSGRGDVAEATMRAKALNCIGVLAYRQGDYRQAQAWHEESLTLYRELGDKVGIASVLNNLGNIAGDQADHRREIALFEESLAISRELGDKRDIAISLNNLGIAVSYLGDVSRAQVLHEEGLTLRRECGDIRGVALTLHNLGDVAQLQGDDERATRLLEESLTIKRELGDTWGIATSLINLGEMAFDHGDHNHAVALLEESLTLLRVLGDKSNIALALIDLGNTAREQGEHERAGTLLEESLRLYETMGDMVGMARSIQGLAQVMAAQQQRLQATRLYGLAAALGAIDDLPLRPAEHAGHNRTLLALRTALGEDAFAAAWAAGEAVQLEQALAYAFENRLVAE